MHSRNIRLGLFVLIASTGRLVSSLATRRAASPSAADWAALNTTVGGRLYPGEPWSLPCFTNYNGNPVAANMTECKFIQDNTFNSHMSRSDFFGTYMGTQWEMCMSTGDQCELDWTEPVDSDAFAPPARCMQGSVPNYYIDVQGASDITAAYNFSMTTGMPLVIKNTGHDLPGRSSAPNSLALWMHHMKYISHNPNFVPEGCTAQSSANALTFGAGEQFADIYKFADDNGLMVVGGSDESVGAAGGWGQAGGHSPLSPTLGLGVDRVLQYKIMTPDGVSRVANSCQNQDLFFALRGGGGGTFGVVLEASIRATPRVPVQVANINWDISDENYKSFLEVFMDNATIFAEQGWGGYVTPSIGNAILLTPKLSPAEASASMQALIDRASTLGSKESSVIQIDSYWTWFQGYVEGKEGTQDAIGFPSVLSSRLIPQANHATPEGRAQLVNLTVETNKQAFFSQIHFTTPYGFNGSTDGTSVTPAWRNSLYQVLFVNTWELNATRADMKASYTLAGQLADQFRAITPGSGAYQNEADIHEPDYQNSFWGSNYARLLQIKNKYDPSHLLDCWHCVNFELVGKAPATPDTRVTFESQHIAAGYHYPTT